MRESSDRASAAALLGLPEDAPPAAVRAAFRRRVQAVHPDRQVDPTATAETARLISAYRTLIAAATGTAPTARARRPSPPAPGPEPATLAVPIPPTADGFFAVLEAAHRIGDVAYASRGDGIVEAIVRDSQGRPCSLLVRLDLQRQVAVTSLDGLAHATPDDVGPFAALLAAHLGP